MSTIIECGACGAHVAPGLYYIEELQGAVWCDACATHPDVTMTTVTVRNPLTGAPILDSDGAMIDITTTTPDPDAPIFIHVTRWTEDHERAARAVRAVYYDHDTDDDDDRHRRHHHPKHQGDA